METKKKKSWGIVLTLLLIILLVGICLYFIFIRPSLLKDEFRNPLDPNGYIPNQNNLVYFDEEETSGYFNNLIYIFFTDDSSSKDRQELIESIDGQIVEETAEINLSLIEIPERSLDELNTLESKLSKNDIVNSTMLDYVTEYQPELTFNDPWTDPSDKYGTTNWDQDILFGTNWWFKAIKANLALELISSLDDLKTTKVGVIDTGFSTDHEDLRITVLNPDFADEDRHGMVVSGVIGATFNNDQGITGINPKAELYGIDVYGTKKQNKYKLRTIDELKAMLVCLENGCKVINLSGGVAEEKKTWDENHEAALRTAKATTKMLIALVNKYEGEFLITQSAGNENENAEHINGYFSTMTENMIDEELKNWNQAFRDSHTSEDIMDHYLVVGSFSENMRDGNFIMPEFSNYGTTVNICAPGTEVLSTTLDNQYDYAAGTSLSAPMVAGAASLLWSLNPDLTSQKVREILLSSAPDDVISEKPLDIVEKYKALDVEAAVLEVYSSENPNPSSKQKEVLDSINKIWNDYGRIYDVFLVRGNGEVIPITPQYYTDGVVTELIQLVGEDVEVPTVTSNKDIIVKYGSNLSYTARVRKVSNIIPSYNMLFHSYTKELSETDLISILNENNYLTKEYFRISDVDNINGQDPLSFLTEHRFGAEEVTGNKSDLNNKIYYLNGSGLDNITFNGVKTNGKTLDVSLVKCTAFVERADSEIMNLPVSPGTVEGSFIVDLTSLENGYYSINAMTNRVFQINK